MDALYLLSVGAQIDTIKQHCFSCGQILFGHITFLDASWAPCGSKDCSVEEKQWDVGPCDLEVAGRTQQYRIIVRKLKEDTK